jgi:hypothetical protein
MREVDPFLYAGYQQRELERITRLLMNMLCEIRRLKEAGILESAEFIACRQLLMDKVHRLERVADEEVDQMMENETERGD